MSTASDRIKVKLTADNRFPKPDPVMHEGAVIFVSACRHCTYFAPSNAHWPCPDCGADDWLGVQATVTKVVG